MITAIDVGQGAVGVASGPPGHHPRVSRWSLRDGQLALLSRSPLAILLHTWRLRRLRRAFAMLNRRLAAYEAAYGLAAVRLNDEDWHKAGMDYKIARPNSLGG